jgi:hypothetical protein
MISSSVIGSVDKDSFVRKCFTVRFVDSKGAALVRTDKNVTDTEP